MLYTRRMTRFYLQRTADKSAAAKAYRAQKRKDLGKFLLSVLVASPPLIGTILFFDSPISIIALWSELDWWWIVLYILGGGFLLLLTLGVPAVAWEDYNDDFSENIPWYGLLVTACYWLTKAMIAIYPNLGSTWSWIGMVVCTVANLIGVIFIIKGLVWVHNEITPYKLYK